MSRVIRPTSVNEPRPAHGLVIDAFHLYRRYPLLFLVLAAAVIVPYEVLILVVIEAGPFEQGSLDAVVGLWLTLADIALVTPLVSALHVHAVREARDGGDPKLAPIARQGLKVLPVVAAASIVSWLGILAGFIALIVPGVILTLRWFVVAQAAAIDDDGWLTALRRGADLTEGRYGHVFVFLLYVAVIAAAPLYLVGLAFGDDSTSAGSFIVAVLVTVVSYSFAALATALLYFDLRARLEVTSVTASAGGDPRRRARRPAASRWIRAITRRRTGRRAGTSTPATPPACATGKRATPRAGAAPPPAPRARSSRLGRPGIEYRVKSLGTYRSLNSSLDRGDARMGGCGRWFSSVRVSHCG